MPTVLLGKCSLPSFIPERGEADGSRDTAARYAYLGVTVTVTALIGLRYSIAGSNEGNWKPSQCDVGNDKHKRLSIMMQTLVCIDIHPFHPKWEGG